MLVITFMHLVSLHSATLRPEQSVGMNRVRRDMSQGQFLLQADLDMQTTVERDQNSVMHPLVAMFPTSFSIQFRHRFQQ
jgi:hypothetical protein